MVTVTAVPALPLPAGGDGFTIERTYYRLDGTEANVSRGDAERALRRRHQGDADNDWPSRIAVTDLLPAGFEIDNPSLVSSARALANFDWLEEIDAAICEFRDDRFVAAFDRNARMNREAFTFAYVVRAVTPGVYVHPAARSRTCTGRNSRPAPRPAKWR